MSLKAKLEAVIYAAEEPVTLAQLSALFADEALEWKAEQEAASAIAAGEKAERLSEGAEDLPLLSGEFGDLEADEAATAATGADREPAADEGQSPSGDETEGAAAELSSAPNSALNSAPNLDLNSEASPEAGPESSSGPDSVDGLADGSVNGPADGLADGPAVEAEAKRLARLGDRKARAVLRQLLDELIAEYASSGRGVEIREIAGGFRMATKPEYHDAVRAFVKNLKPVLKLSLPALETLAVIAYKQPVTAPEVNEIRGVDSSGVFGSLLARKLIVPAGRKPVVGRPILYKTTREFLLRFGLKGVSELPSMEEFEQMAATEFEEPEVVEEREFAAGIRQDLSLELDELSNGESSNGVLAGEQTGDAAEETPVAEPPEAAEAEPDTSEAVPAAPQATE